GGFVAAARIASASARVVSTRLSRISFFQAGLQRLPATLAPARFTTASVPSTWMGAAPARGRRIASSPRARKAFERWVPIKPLAPAIATFMRTWYAMGDMLRNVNELCWVTLQVADVDRSRRFWREVIGLPEKSYTPQWVELELRPGLLLALHSVFYAKALEKEGYDRGGAVLG